MKQFTTTNIFKGLLTSVLVLLFSLTASWAQEAEKKEDKPVTDTYNSGTFLENQTCYQNGKNVKELVINHRFGKISDGRKELWGIYAPSNIRMGLNYGITDNVQVGFGTTKFYKQQDFNLKWTIKEQTQSGSMPVTLGYYGAAYIDGRDVNSFSYENFKPIHRMSFFNEIMISRKFCDAFNMQVALMHAHYNAVENNTGNSIEIDSATAPVLFSPVRNNDSFGLSALGKLNITPTFSVVFEGDYSFDYPLISEDRQNVYKSPKPVFVIGVEKATAAHSMQLFVTTAESIVNQRNMVYNQNTVLGDGTTKSGIMIGFNLTRVMY